MSPIAFDNTYARLPDTFYARLSPKPVASPSLIRVNHAFAEVLGIDPAFFETPEGLGMVSGNRVPDGAEPLAMAYAGHQFGHFVPQLGDGRANLLGEIVAKDGVRRDIQLKGAGPTPFSRMGDGRAALGPVLREYIVSEAMHHLGVPTTRALAAVTTGEPVVREYLLPGAILTRVAKSHIRVGTFQFFLARQDHDSLKALTDHAIARHVPDAADAERPALALLDHVVERQAALIAKWMSLGFIHGVMNTDNMSIAGETIDYGPCAFLDTYEPAKVFSSVDEMGRYAYQNQPGIGQWNLVRLAQCLLGLIDDNEETALALAQQSIDAYSAKFDRFYLEEFTRKLGFEDVQDGDEALIQGVLKLLNENDVDFTLFFRRLGEFVGGRNELLTMFPDANVFFQWAMGWQGRIEETSGDDPAKSARLLKVNPAIIPRNHLVEQAIRAAEDEGDFKVFEALTVALETPFDDQPESSPYTSPPEANERVLKTFCGT